MKLLENKNKFLIFELNVSELKDLNIGVRIPMRDLGLYNMNEVVEYSDSFYYKIFVCDFCNDSMTDKLYYVPILSRAICKSCLDDFIKDKHYASDVEYEVDRFNSFVDDLISVGLIKEGDINKIDFKEFIKNNIKYLDLTEFEPEYYGIEI